MGELQKTLDEQSIEVIDNQKESLVGRKALAERTKGKRMDVQRIGTLLNGGFRVQKDIG